MVTRRDFLKKLGLGAAGTLAFPEVLSKSASLQDPSIGFTFATWSPKLYDDAVLDKLAYMGIKDIAIHIPAYQRTDRSTMLSRHRLIKGKDKDVIARFGTPLDDTVASLIEEAKRHDMSVMLKPSIFVERGGWHGTIQPYSAKEWFTSYSDFVSHYARIAQECKAEYFSIGNEMSSLVKHENHWRELIKLVRSEFKGALTYSESSFEYTKVPFYDALDFIGLNAYFPLKFNYAENKGSHTFFSELMNAWWWHAREINDFVRASQKPMMFTEFGVRSVDDAVFKPWDFEHRGTADLREQYLAYRSLLKALDRKIVRPEKVYLWASDHGTDLEKNHPTGYDFLGKPAEGVIRRYIKGKPL